MPMLDWKNKSFKKKKQASQSNGKDKYGKKYPTQLQKWMAKANRSWKHPEYGQWLVAKNGAP